MDALSVSGFLPTDPRYAPFGLRWLSGLNATRVALVLLVGLMLSTRTAVGGAFAGDVPGALVHLAFSVPRNLLKWMPGLILVTAADNLTAGQGPLRRVPAFAAAALFAALIAVWLGPPVSCLGFGYLRQTSGRCGFLLDAPFTAGDLQLLMYAAILTALVYHQSSQRTHAAWLRRALLTSIDADRQLKEARLRGLRAQIEPHFLFNTLAHVRRLYQLDPGKGRKMQRDLADYLRAAMWGLRGADETLGGELAMIRAYLRLQQTRMGARLHYDIDVADNLAAAELPAMMLLTLVENAVKHGVEPKRGGGRIVVCAKRSGDRLDLEVIDDGVGLSVGAGTGVGLANTLARLETQFGSAARLELANREQGGVVARLTLPLQQRASSAAAA